MIKTKIENADLMNKWLKNRGGIAVWGSIDLSDLGKQWFTPADVTSKPHWQSANEPCKIVTDPNDVHLYKDKEVKRFHVAIRMGAQGLKIKCTDASSNKIRNAIEKAGEGSWHEFDYETQEAVIYAPDGDVITLAQHFMLKEKEHD